MEFWLKQDKDSSGFQLPVNPPKLEIDKVLNNGTFTTEMYGERSFLGTEKLKTFEISSFFPANIGTYCLCTPKSNPEEYISIIDDWIKNKWTVRVIVTGTSLNMLCSIEEFKHSIEFGTKDITFTLSLKEYIEVNGISIQDATVTSNSSTSSASATETLKTIQTNLIKLHIPTGSSKSLTSNGINDSITNSTVKEFQYIMGLKQDGHWDTNCANALKEVLSKPTCGTAYVHKYSTRYIQWWLGINIDGIFYTQASISTKKFQKAHKLTQDGIFGSTTWGVIF